MPDNPAQRQLGPASETYQQMLESIVFLYDTPPEGEDTPSPMQFPIGTGFLLAFPAQGTLERGGRWGQAFFHIVTNKHILHTQNSAEFKRQLVLRVNNLDGNQAIFHSLDLHYNGKALNVFFHPNEIVDLASIRLPNIPNFLPMGLTHEMIAGAQEFLLKAPIGTNTFTAGYLSGYAGVERIHPAVRFGRISLVSSEEWYRSARISLNVGRREKAFLVEIPAYGGASGSPLLIDVRLEDEVDPIIIGVVKGSMYTQEDNQRDTREQGLVAIEPVESLLELTEITFAFEQAHTRYTLIPRRT